ncbi:MAG: DUF3568 family protein [Isosphaeraceae bacterium]
MRRIALTAAACCWLTLPGCASVRPLPLIGMDSTPTDFSFSAGRASQTFKGTPTSVQPAVVAALDDLRISAVHQRLDGGAIMYEATTADNRGANVALRPQPSGTTRVTARIGVFGDEALSRALMDRIAIRLGALPPDAVPVDPPSTPGGNPYFSRDAVSDEEMLKERSDALNRGADAP